jgi:pimeloyl-ACP methyl ester carboxylesterase
MRSMTAQKRGWRYWRNLAVFALFALFAGWLVSFYLGHPFFHSQGFAHPQRLAVCCVTPADRGLPYEEVTFPTRDGLTLHGWYLPSHNTATVMLLHPLASNRVAMLEVATLLAHHDYGVLLFDLRAQGESDGDVLPYGGNEAEDVRGAADYLQTRADVDAQRIGALGWSLGAQVSILGAARTDQIRAVIADGPCCTVASDWGPPHTFSDWLYVPYDLVFYQFLNWRTGVAYPVSVRDALAALTPRPVLLIGGGAEQQRLEYLYSRAQEPKTLWIIPEAGHIDGLNARPTEYEEKIVHFFDQALLGNRP